MSDRSASTDDLIAKAKAACEAGSPLRAESLCERGLARLRSREMSAGSIAAVDRIARLLVLARRDRLERALQSGRVWVLSTPGDMPAEPGDGCYLVQPPMIGLQGQRLGQSLGARGVHAVVVTREPMTASGLWPIVAVGERTVRARVDPPQCAVRTGEGITGDRLDGLPGAGWFELATGALVDAGLDRVDADEPAAWRVEDLLDLLDAHRDSAAVCAHLARVCHEASREAMPAGLRRRPLVDDPFSF